MNENDILDSQQPVDTVDGDFEDISADNPESSEVIEDVEEDVQISEVGETEGSDVFIDFPDYSVDNPLPVYIVEPEEVEEPEEELEVFSASGSYPGTISTTYLDYFEGIVEKLSPKNHYVVWRSGQYAYTLAYGENIGYSSGTFLGNCYTVEIYRNSSSYSSDWYTRSGTDSLALDASGLFIYSDLGMFPRFERGLRYGEEMAVLVAICVATVFLLASRIFDYIVKYIYKRTSI